MPSPVWLGPAFAQIGCDHRPEMIDPAPNRLVRDQNPTLRQQIFHIAKTEREPKIQPYSLVYDLRREPVAGVADFLHSFRYRTARPTASRRSRDNALESVHAPKIATASLPAAKFHTPGAARN